MDAVAAELISLQRKRKILGLVSHALGGVILIITSDCSLIFSRQVDLCSQDDFYLLKTNNIHTG